jgi:hypothetical protein
MALPPLSVGAFSWFLMLGVGFVGHLSQQKKRTENKIMAPKFSSFIMLVFDELLHGLNSSYRWFEFPCSEC